MSRGKIFIVFGQAGLYSDFSTWDVCAYADRAVAEEHARLAQDERKKIEASGFIEEYAEDGHPLFEQIKTRLWDRTMFYLYSRDVSYGVRELELHEQLKSPEPGEVRPT